MMQLFPFSAPGAALRLPGALALGFAAALALAPLVVAWADAGPRPEARPGPRAEPLLGPSPGSSLIPSLGPRLGVATNFGQGWQPGILAAAEALGVRDFRDALYWRDVERSDGRLVFGDDPRVNFPRRLAAMGARMSLTVNNGHPARDGGATPSSPAAVAAFARFAAAAVARFPAIDAVEVGNEMNSERFVSGPAWEVPLRERARRYAALLAATARAVRDSRPGVRILGGAAHSVPLAWFAALSEAGAPAFMDAVVIHPYGVAPEDLGRLIALLRELPGYAELPVKITEFGHADPDLAPDHLLRSYCAMALSGVSRAVWYPLAPRGDGLAPLIDREGRPTAVGQGFALIARELEGRPVRDAAPDPFTHACAFGEGRLVIWGAPRGIALAPGLEALDARGRVLPQAGLSLSRGRAILIRPRAGAAAGAAGGATGGAAGGTTGGAEPRLGATVRLAAQRVVADSRDQFVFPGPGRRGPFTLLARRADGRGAQEMQTRPGQERAGVPWVPYLGTSLHGMARAGPGWVLPAGGGAGAVEVIVRHEVREGGRFDLAVEAEPLPRSDDGVVVRVLRDGEELARRHVTAPALLRLDGLELRAGARLEVAVGPGANARGDVTRLRVTLLDPGAAVGPGLPEPPER